MLAELVEPGKGAGTRSDRAAPTYVLLTPAGDPSTPCAASVAKTTGMRTTDIFNLDFTTPGAMKPDMEARVSQAFQHTRCAIAALEDALGKGCNDIGAWRLLAALHMGSGDMSAFNEVDEAFEQTFGSPAFAVSRQPKPPLDAERTLFEMPARLTADSMPNAALIGRACAEANGATLDFSRVRGADAGGLRALRELLRGVPRDDSRPETPGLDRFMAGLERAAQSATGSLEMWETLFDYLRFCNDPHGFDDLSIRFAVKFGISPPTF